MSYRTSITNVPYRGEIDLGRVGSGVGTPHYVYPLARIVEGFCSFHKAFLLLSVGLFRIGKATDLPKRSG